MPPQAPPQEGMCLRELVGEEDLIDERVCQKYLLFGTLNLFYNCLVIFIKGARMTTNEDCIKQTISH